MSDIFNNYCINCDKLCTQNSVYCSEECKSIEYQQSLTPISCNSPTYSNTTNNNQELVSPLLTPALYHHQYLHSELCQSPLILSTNTGIIQEEESTRELDYFDLNYSVNSNVNYSNATDLVNSTSHNYRKWLTAL